MKAGEGKPILHMSKDNENAHGGGKFGVRIKIGGIRIFGEVSRIFNFADVVVEGEGATSPWVGGVRGVGGGFGQVPDENTVEVGSGSFDGEATEEGMIEAGEIGRAHV